ncbi:MAG: bifunctional nuclease family protein [Desulfobacterales bacterium]|nr:bifunctional nuclease family protein [Desulfobacterales bacterium]MDD4073206.1 bifunctional nuclease family protein [Desulfobacterales bacterium]MDD4392298.1 bifunctional nuclease family protein [Desulfobacterales bacterium]
MLHKASIAGMTIDPASNTPIIILKLDDQDVSIPIWIGLFEATSIATVLQNIKFDRPMTHDLFKNLMDRVHMNVDRVEVCDLADNTYYARIHFMSGEESFSMDARPSDAIAIALRFEAPIYVDDTVVEKSASENNKGEIADKSEEGKKWAEYLSTMSSDDFGKYKI